VIASLLPPVGQAKKRFGVGNERIPLGIAMSDIPTVGISELAPARTLVEALHSWCGFAELAPASLSRVTIPYLALQNTPGANWSWNQVPKQRLAPLGCSFLRDVEICGSGYFFHDGRFVREFVNISDVALRWLRQPDFFDNPLTMPRTNRTVIEEPVLLVFGPGSSIYGHWLLDFMPRIVIAQRLLGTALGDFVLPLPSDTPEWVVRMIHTLCGIEPSRFRYYARHDDLVVCRRVCMPSYAHSGKPGDYAPHSLMREFYDQFGNPGAPRAKWRICLSRRNQERHTLGVWRKFDARETMEQMAAARGFQIVQPEELGFPEQIELFRSAGCILGEHGSGMHAAVFADPGTIVATVGAWNRHQLNISAAFEQRSICLTRLQKTEAIQNEPFRFTATEDDLAGLFALIDIVQDSRPADFGRFAYLDRHQ
jgi:capsular polysaccharide biosynthesis protein